MTAQRVVRLADLGADERRVILALIDADNSHKAALEAHSLHAERRDGCYLCDQRAIHDSGKKHWPPGCHLCPRPEKA